MEIKISPTENPMNNLTAKEVNGAIKTAKQEGRISMAKEIVGRLTEIEKQKDSVELENYIQDLRNKVKEWLGERK